MENVKLDIYNILGQNISSLVKGELNAGYIMLNLMLKIYQAEFIFIN